MKRSVKIALGTSALAVVGGLFLVGTSFADRSFGPLGLGPMGDGVGNQMLQSVDTNGDGALSQDEINAAVNSRFAEFDADKNGSLSLQEFEALWAEITKPMAVRAFQFLDPDGDAAVSKAEVDTRFGTIVSELDHNGDGLLSRADHPRHPHGPHGGPRHWWQHGPGGDGPGDNGPGESGPGENGPPPAPEGDQP